MMSALAFLFLGVYTLSLTYVTFYCLSQFNLLFYYKRFDWRRKKEEFQAKFAAQAQAQMAGVAAAQVGGKTLSTNAPIIAADGSLNLMSQEEYEKAFPFVTIQLPLYNEKYVVERLIDNMVLMDYPRDRFEIHVLDDSTDETQDLVRAKVAYHQAQGVNIEQIRRKERKGYKAGALKDGTEFAKGEFLAIFDADFLPRPDFLKKTIPHFQDPSVGVVQTRWEHINEDYSLITRLQALQLNVHFTVEQVGRMEGKHFLQFNGTAGVWRRKTIEDAGGWEADTLTEDLDLSIRSQLKGYRIKFLEDISVPAELPADMNALKAQQFRWMKGGAETARKMLPIVWNSNMNLMQKLNSTLHLLASTVFMFVFVMAASSIPLLYLVNVLSKRHGFDKDFFTWYLLGMLSITLMYYVANVQSKARRSTTFKSVIRFITHFPLFLAMSMGLSLHNTIAVIEGWRGKKSPFVRTPKFNIKDGKDQFSNNKYLKKSLSWGTYMEGFMAFMFLVAVVWSAYWGETIFIVYHVMMTIGFSSIFLLSWKHARA
jgi:cellulose synthase/poly-beta-1,6-N-acetylglucosamine synthase-like glycosyltransferase